MASPPSNPKPNPKTHTHTYPPFTLSSPPKTDIWRKPPTHNAFNAPTHPSQLPTYPLLSLTRARLTLTLPAHPHLPRQYDQAGLLLHVTHPDVPAEKCKWLKTGIEWYNEGPYVSTVGCDRWADWSVVPLSVVTANTKDNTNKNNNNNNNNNNNDNDDDNNNNSNNTKNPDPKAYKATLQVQQSHDSLGSSLWVYLVGGEGQLVPLREVNWFFAPVVAGGKRDGDGDGDGDRDRDGGWKVGVGAYVARPTGVGEQDQEELVARFEGLEVEVEVF